MPKPLTCDPALLDLDLHGRRYVITGANSGIGLVTARQLAAQGAEVVMACRRVGEAEARIAEIRAELPDARLEARELDLGSLASVRVFAEGLLADGGRLDGLVNNAGVMNTPQGRTADGFELQLGINHLGHFLLTELLRPMLQRSAPSRIVNLSSCFHDKAMGREGDIHFDDLHYDRRRYDGWEAYAQSKLANLLHARGLARRLDGTGVTAVSVHPGWVRTNLARNTMPMWMQDFVLRPVFRVMGMIEPWEGAQTTLHCLLADDVPQHAGAYYSQTGTYRDKAANKGGWPLRSPNPRAHDDALVERLWQVSERLVGLAEEAPAR
ncbi:MAG: SDR family oxidoreductase [Deltaproteobacteria bacterium]|nr:MAG: SDR family oxidoreductase [Deltaproteobacteria bacterium]